MRIAIFDYLVIPTNAIGNCDRHLIAGLNKDHQFTIFALELDNPAPENIEFVRVPAIRRPLFLLFISYHIMALLVFWLYQLRHKVRFDLIQTVESKTLGGKLVYSHFCHKAYLQKYWGSTGAKGLRGAARWLDHLLHQWAEPIVYRQASQVVVPSNGLKRELLEAYPKLEGKVAVIANPIDTERMKAPADFDRAGKRRELGLEADDLVLVFMALGHFERKGLPLLMQALQILGQPTIKLVVVGGTPSQIESLKQSAENLGIGANLRFVGLQSDVRPFLWAGDVYAFPSHYETFSLVCFEAAAAGLPLLVSHLHGVEDFLVHDENGWLVERNPQALAEAIRKAAGDRAKLQAMGRQALVGVQAYDKAHFVAAWRDYYQTQFQNTIVSPVGTDTIHGN